VSLRRMEATGALAKGSGDASFSCTSALPHHPCCPAFSLALQRGSPATCNLYYHRPSLPPPPPTARAGFFNFQLDLMSVLIDSEAASSWNQIKILRIRMGAANLFYFWWGLLIGASLTALTWLRCCSTSCWCAQGMAWANDPCGGAAASVPRAGVSAPALVDSNRSTLAHGLPHCATPTMRVPPRVGQAKPKATALGRGGRRALAFALAGGRGRTAARSLVARGRRSHPPTRGVCLPCPTQAASELVAAGYRLEPAAARSGEPTDAPRPHAGLYHGLCRCPRHHGRSTRPWQAAHHRGKLGYLS
jgi:hypothetical protein